MKFLRATATAGVRALALMLVVHGHALTAQDASLFVAVGHDGRRAISRDGQSWEDQPIPSNEESKDGALLAVVHGAGRFVAVGEGDRGGRILSSEDGRKWQTALDTRGPVSTVAFGNGRFVACGREGLISSDDGLVFRSGQAWEWSGKTTPRRSACGDTEAGFRYVIIGQVEQDKFSLPASWRGATGDGMRWVDTPIETVPVNDIAYGAGIFVVVGPYGLIESSHDGQTWASRASIPDEDFGRVVWTGSRFLVRGLQTAWSSPDGFEWKQEAEALPFDVVWAREKKLGIGLSVIGELCTSQDLVHWKKAKLADGPPFFAVAGRE